MTLREIIGASALALLASTAYAQNQDSSSSTMAHPGPAQTAPPASATMPPPATNSNDPYVKKRMEDKAAKKQYKTEKKAAKSDYKQEKKQAKAKLKQDLSAQPAPSGETDQPGK